MIKLYFLLLKKGIHCLNVIYKEKYWIKKSLPNSILLVAKLVPSSRVKKERKIITKQVINFLIKF